MSVDGVKWHCSWRWRASSHLSLLASELAITSLIATVSLPPPAPPRLPSGGGGDGLADHPGREPHCADEGVQGGAAVCGRGRGGEGRVALDGQRMHGRGNGVHRSCMRVSNAIRRSVACPGLSRVACLSHAHVSPVTEIANWGRMPIERHAAWPNSMLATRRGMGLAASMWGGVAV